MRLVSKQNYCFCNNGRICKTIFSRNSHCQIKIHFKLTQKIVDLTPWKCSGILMTFVAVNNEKINLCEQQPCRSFFHVVVAKNQSVWWSMHVFSVQFSYTFSYRDVFEIKTFINPWTYPWSYRIYGRRTSIIFFRILVIFSKCTPNVRPWI